MPSITLDRLWLHQADDLDTYLRFFSTGRGDERAVVGEVRVYAQGRRRIITRTGSAQVLTATLRQVTDADLSTLEDWRGVLLMLRDHLGRLVWGTFFDMAVTDYADRSGYDVALTFQQVTTTLPEV